MASGRRTNLSCTFAGVVDDLLGYQSTSRGWLGDTVRGWMCRLTRYYVPAFCAGVVPAAACAGGLGRWSSRCLGDDEVDAVGHEPQSDDQAPRDDDLVG